MTYVIVHVTKPHPQYDLPCVGNVFGPFPNAAAAIAVAQSLGGLSKGYVTRPIHELPKP